MPDLRVSVLVHRAHGPLHLDVVSGVGAHCPTWSLSMSGAGLRLVRKPDHRRRYLTYRGPVGAGRGVVQALGRGWLRGAPRAAAWSLAITFNSLWNKQLCRFLQSGRAAFPEARVWQLRGFGERVVRNRLIPRIPRHERLG